LTKVVPPHPEKDARGTAGQLGRGAHRDAKTLGLAWPKAWAERPLTFPREETFAFRRLVGAHMMGDDVIALDTARRPARFRDLAWVQADAMSFTHGDRQN
jgi:hypothetical protein